MKQYDLIVVGGGFAGVGAAIAAARSGIRVLIVEKGNCLGGAATNALVNPFMSVETKINGAWTDLSRGIFLEIRRELEKFGWSIRERVWHNASFSEEGLKLILNRMVKESGADILFHAYLAEVKREGESVQSLTFATRGGKIELKAPYYIDATGDAQLSFLGGVPTRLGREKDNLCQPMTLCFRIGNADKDKFFAALPSVEKLYNQMQAEGKIKNPYHSVLVFDTVLTGVLHFNSTRVVKKNPVDPFDFSEAEIEAREQVFELFTFLKENADGMQNAELLASAAEIGVRESRMIEGEYKLTGEECVKRTVFPDAIAACNYSIDIHNPEGSGTSIYAFPEGSYYTIPYRCLIPKGVNNLLVAGRCISSDHESQASYRVMPTVCNIGEAAGVAAALAVKGNLSVRDIDVAALQKILVERGAFLG